MTIQTVSTSNTFNEWRVVTNSLVTEVNKTELGTAQLYVDTVTANTITSNGDITVNGGDLNTTSATFNFANTTATTVNIGGDATTVKIGSTSGTTDVRNNLNVGGDLDVDGGDITVSTSTANLLNTTATTVNFAGAATTLEIGAATGTTNINNDLDVDGDVNIDGGDLTVSTASFNLANTNATTLNFAGAATTLNLGAASGTTTIRNDAAVSGTLSVTGNTTLTGDIAVNGGDITTTQTTFNVANATATTLNVGGAATTLNLGAASGTTTIRNDLSVSGTFAATGNVTLSGELRGPSTFVIDPAVVGDDTGTVRIRGNLQVDGTTTTINSTTLTVDDKNIVLADGAANNSAADGAGITIAGSNASITYLASGDKINVNKALEASNTLTVTGATTLSSTLGVTGVATFSADSRFTSTGAVLISKGTSGQQPGTPEVGMLRYNTSTGEFEGYSGASPSWKSVGGSAITNDTSTASDLYPAFLADTANTALNIYTSNSKLLYKPSTGELKAEQFVAQNGLFVNSTIIDANYTIGANTNAFSVGPITVANGSAVTVSSGQRWVVI